jgi:16S rRNA (guanine1516-N2)-methyltransferase
VAVATDPPDNSLLANHARTLAQSLNLPLLDSTAHANVEMLLAVTPLRLELRILQGPRELTSGKPVIADLSRLDLTTPAGRSLDQPLLKAVGIRRGDRHRPMVLDVTAGFGEDAWLLASFGCRVMAVERQAVVAMLLADAMQPGAEGFPVTLGNMTLIHADSIQLLEHYRENRLPQEIKGWFPPEVITIDPMFPDYDKRKAAEHKSLKILRRLVGEDLDAGGLLELALKIATCRVVVKRPLRADPLGGTMERPHHQVEGKGFRWDIYVVTGT